MKQINDVNIQKIVNELMQMDIKSVVKFYFSIKYEEAEIDKALHNIDFIIRENKPIDNIPKIEKIDDTYTPAIKNKPSETIQNWIKRIFEYMLKNNLLSDEEIYFLHDKEYSKLVFGISLALFVDRWRDIIISGHERYWVNPIGQYYICSQWWKEKDKEYEVKIYRWLQKVLPNYDERGLSRRHG